MNFNPFIVHQFNFYAYYLFVQFFLCKIFMNNGLHSLNIILAVDTD